MVLQHFRKVFLFGCVVIVAFGISSCGILYFRTIECRDFSYHNNLVWYAGNIGDTISFANQDLVLRHFVIQRKTLIHYKKYVSDTGCGCLDEWLMMIKDNDGNYMYLKEGGTYIYDNEPSMYKWLVYSDEEKYNVSEDGSGVYQDSLVLNGRTLYGIRKYTFPPESKNDFHTIFVAKYFGIVQIESQENDVWINTRLTDTLDTSFDSFDYYYKETCK